MKHKHSAESNNKFWTIGQMKKQHTPEITQTQSVEDWLSQGGKITRCPPGPEPESKQSVRSAACGFGVTHSVNPSFGQ